MVATADGLKRVPAAAATASLAPKRPGRSSMAGISGPSATAGHSPAAVSCRSAAGQMSDRTLTAFGPLSLASAS
jgi:hypothetical protein